MNKDEWTIYAHGFFDGILIALWIVAMAAAAMRYVYDGGLW